MMSVSVAMATYNGRQHIRRQLDSLAAQSHPPAELVVTDDCSDDDTIALIQEFSKTASFPVKVYRNETRLGYRTNFMRAASLCRSELIAFCDQDDYWYPIKIAQSVAPFEDSEILLTYHNADVVGEDGIRIGSLANRAAPITSGPWFFAPGFTEVFRQSLLELSNLWPQSRDSMESGEPSAHDKWFFFLATVFGKVAYVDNPLVAYVQHANNTYGWTKLSLREWTKYILRDRAIEISIFATAAENRAVILRRAMTDLEGPWRQRAEAATVYYDKLRQVCFKRIAVHTSKSASERHKNFWGVLRQTGYAGTWGLGRKTFIVDLCALLIGPILNSRTV